MQKINSVPPRMANCMPVPTVTFFNQLTDNRGDDGLVITIILIIHKYSHCCSYVLRPIIYIQVIRLPLDLENKTGVYFPSCTRVNRCKFNKSLQDITKACFEVITAIVWNGNKFECYKVTSIWTNYSLKQKVILVHICNSRLTSWIALGPLIISVKQVGVVVFIINFAASQRLVKWSI